MSVFREKERCQPVIPSIVSAYNENLEGNSVVSKAVRLRDMGWNTVRKGRALKRRSMVEEGFIHLLTSQAELSCLGPEGASFAREDYATRARIAQAFCATGELDRAIKFAKDALAITPRPFEDTVVLSKGLNARTARRVFPDQYEIIFTSRLAMIMAGSGEDEDMEVADLLAGRAREIAPLSQDPNRVMYVDYQMTDRARTTQKWEDMGMAAAATACATMPLGASRFVAQKICAR